MNNLREVFEENGFKILAILCFMLLAYIDIQHKKSERDANLCNDAKIEVCALCKDGTLKLLKGER